MSDELLNRETLQQIAAYHQSRKPFDYKDVCGEVYLEHVETLLTEVERLTQALRVIDDRLARWLLLPTGTRLADLRQYVADVLEGAK